ncbi:hypothetical protein M408DRAFT_330451 [Serendipita vermifera MAFF 305830]|uniref:BZIP domain-containing protein n=1 Tax=Serendipita vermifera MAFF 305830 TaxID=933852 RepID=A0A0C2WK18_SERVB|nr:hypothetical protein M408DRAFT_330451 [Serendipita vermifera MAFF 305830]
MAKTAESSIQGLNIIPTDSISDELSPMSDELNRDLEAQLALWTNFQFPSSSAIPTSNTEEDERVFAPERDTASRSRHKAIEEFSSSSFFGNVGASLAAGPSNAGYERAKMQQLQQHLNRTAAAAAADKQQQPFLHSMNELFPSFSPYGGNNHSHHDSSQDHGMDMNLDALVDPFFTPQDYANNNTNNTSVNGGGGLPPLTVRHTRDGSGRPQTIDPTTTSLTNRPTVPLPTSTKRAKANNKQLPNLVIPVDHHYAPAPESAMGDDDMDHDEDMHNLAGGHSLTDANGQPISAAEDKRRRNTLASARFRQKKKEREAAMERKARDLDDRVANLERECESLRKENKMLRGLLVDGVPAAAASVADGVDAGDKGASTAASVAMVAPGASVVLLEELVRLLKANSAVLTAPGGQGQTAATPASPTKTSSTGKRKRGAGN